MLSDEWLPRYRLLENFTAKWNGNGNGNGNAYDRGDYNSFFALRAVELMTLGVFLISGNASRVQEFQRTLPLLSSHLGEVTHKNNMGRISKRGVSFAIGQRLISFSHL